MAWPTALLEIAARGAAPDFAEHLRELARAAKGSSWEHATLDEERGLEQWVLSFAAFGHEAIATASLAAARLAFPQVVERAGDEAVEFAITEDAPCMDGEPIGMQLRRVEAWLAAPNEETRAALQGAFDPTRQLEIWDDDLRPPDDAYDVSWQWFMEVGQLCIGACLWAMDGESEGSSYYGWTAPYGAARAVVCCAKAMRSGPDGVEADVARIGEAVASAFGARAD